MAQKTAWTGGAATESDINTYLMHEGGAWTTYTPTLTQSATVTKTVTSARWGRASRFIYGQVLLTVTGAGTAANAVLVGLPVAAITQTNLMMGNLGIFDTSAGIWYHGMALQSSTTAVYGIASGATGTLGGVTFTAALAVGDLVLLNFHYESAT